MSKSVGRPTKRHKKVGLHVSIPVGLSDTVRIIIDRYPGRFASISGFTTEALMSYISLLSIAVNNKVTPEVMLDRLIQNYPDAEGE